MKPIVFIFLTLIGTSPLSADNDGKERLSNDLIGRYRAAMTNQQDALKNMSMEVLMEGSIPRLKKQGKMSALKMISGLGSITFKMLGFWGDDTVKKEVMARYMTAEQEASNKNGSKDDISITDDNYEFKFKGLNTREGRSVYIFELKPKHKRLGLFKGELWLDPETCLPLRETGKLVKNPSVFIKKMEFTRDYEIRDGIAYLQRMDSRTETRIVGAAELHIQYANFKKQEPDAEKAVEEAHDPTPTNQ